MTILRNDVDFHWHKKGIDAAGRYEHRHNGTPDRYPCMVESTHWDDPNGPYTVDHEFTYQRKVTCAHCGHVEIKWPNEIPES